MWIEAPNIDAAKVFFEEEADDFSKLVDIQKTFNW